MKYIAIAEDDVSKLSQQTLTETDLYIAIENRAVKVINYISDNTDIFQEGNSSEILMKAIDSDINTFIKVLQSVGTRKNYQGIALYAAKKSKRYILNYILKYGLDDYEILKYAKSVGDDNLLRQLYFFNIKDDESVTMIGM